MPVEVDTFEPAEGPVGLLVRIYGNGFDGRNTKVYFFDEVEATYAIVDSEGEIQAKVPAGAKSGFIVVKNDGGRGQSAKQFKVLTEGVWVLSFDPKSGSSGRKINVWGKGFTGCQSVKFGEKNAHSFRVESDDAIEASVPYDAQPAKVKIKVTTPKGVGESNTKFEIT